MFENGKLRVALTAVVLLSGAALVAQDHLAVFYFGGKRVFVGMSQTEALAVLSTCCKQGCSGKPVKRAIREKSLSRVNTLARYSSAIAAISASIVVRLTPLGRPIRKITFAGDVYPDSVGPLLRESLVPPAPTDALYHDK